RPALGQAVEVLDPGAPDAATRVDRMLDAVAQGVDLGGQLAQRVVLERGDPRIRVALLHLAAQHVVDERVGDRAAARVAADTGDVAGRVEGIADGQTTGIGHRDHFAQPVAGLDGGLAARVGLRGGQAAAGDSDLRLVFRDSAAPQCTTPLTRTNWLRPLHLHPNYLGNLRPRRSRLPLPQELADIDANQHSPLSRA